MKDTLNIRQIIGRQLVRAGQVILGEKDPYSLTNVSEITFRNPFTAIHIGRRGVKMTPRVLNVVRGWNDVTIVGKNHLLDVVFGNSSPVTQVNPWYIGLINNTPTPTLSENDTLSSHSGWSEFTSYSGNRKAWDDANASSKIKGTTSVSTFTASGSGTIYGIFIASVSTGTSGILWATGAFDATVSLITSDDLKVSYGIRT
jgi:hypothetical protein